MIFTRIVLTAALSLACEAHADAQAIPLAACDESARLHLEAPLSRSLLDGRLYSCASRRIMSDSERCMDAASVNDCRPPGSTVEIHELRFTRGGRTVVVAQSTTWTAWPRVTAQRRGPYSAFEITEQEQYQHRSRTVRYMVLRDQDPVFNEVIVECEDNGGGGRMSCSPREPVRWLSAHTLSVGRGSDRTVVDLRTAPIIEC